jgi:hypothetical protein
MLTLQPRFYPWLRVIVYVFEILVRTNFIRWQGSEAILRPQLSKKNAGKKNKH